MVNMPRMVWIAGIFVLLLVESSYAGMKKRYLIKYRGEERPRVVHVDPRLVPTVGASLFKQGLAVGEKLELQYVQEDVHMQAIKTPGDDVGIEDPEFFHQWSHFKREGGLDAPAAWNISTGSEKTVVAVIDTGISRHSEINAKIIGGHDFITDINIANDGDGRDSDWRDPGDWVSEGDDCFESGSAPSSWHGTHIAGIIAAETANGKGMAGINWRAKILAVRVLGKCGGFSSDIADGIRWAAGGQVSDVPTNPNPAQVINLSLGGPGICNTYLQEAIDFAHSVGTVVVVAVGNENKNIDEEDFSPANCNGVIRVGSNNTFEQRSSFSNTGTLVDILAPGGGIGGGIYSLSNFGTEGPEGESYMTYSGTSMAAPHISGVVSLIHSVRPGLFPNQIKKIIKDSARKIDCDVDHGCGSGVADAYQALSLARVTVPNANVGDDTISGKRAVSEQSADQRVTSNNSDGGGMCGNIVFIDDDSDGPGSFFLLGLLAFLAHVCWYWRERIRR